MASVLMADSSNAVKQAMLEEGVETLAVFFGKNKANDVIMSHMITFLNDKDDAQLRDSFYRNIVKVVAYIGWPSTQIIVPLLQQGLCDTEENVIASCIDAMSRLTTPELMNKSTLYQLLPEAVPFLLHPNLWIRQATAGKTELQFPLLKKSFFNVQRIRQRLRPLPALFRRHRAPPASPAPLRSLGRLSGQPITLFLTLVAFLGNLVCRFVLSQRKGGSPKNTHAGLKTISVLETCV